jgi:N6-L-threonylcarbamoyladenine synthase
LFLLLNPVPLPTILAIESSCDETSASVCVDGKILSNFIANQTVHEKYGGVVPELASRAHMQNIVPVIDAALKEAFPLQAPDPVSRLWMR